MLQHSVLRIAGTVVLAVAVVHASDRDRTSACLRATLPFETDRINIFEVDTNPLPGNRLPVLYFFICSHEI